MSESDKRMDHAAEAVVCIEAAHRAIREAEEGRASYEVASVLMAQANVHATLALAEQQRIANLLALGEFRVAPDGVPLFRALVVEALGEWDVRPSAAIREGLGL